VKRDSRITHSCKEEIQMELLMTVLRLIHIGAGIFWVGATFFTEGFLAPTVMASGPEGGRFMQRLMNGTRFQTAISVTPMLTMLSGIIMYGRDFAIRDGFAWLGSYEGLALTIGGLAGLLTLIPVFRLLRPANFKLMELGQQIASAGGPPSPALLAEMASWQEKRALGGRLTVLLMIIAVIGMATARPF
jgi:uncharacterized membrane protein